MNCLNCSKELEQVKGKKQRYYCNDFCRITHNRKLKSEQSKSEQSNPNKVVSVENNPQNVTPVLGRESHRGLVKAGDILVPGNLDIYRRPDGSRYIIDAGGVKSELPLLDIEEIKSPTLKVLSAQYTKAKTGNFSGYKAGASKYLPKNAVDFQRVTANA